MQAGDLLLLSYTVLAWALTVNNGFFRPNTFALAFFVFITLCFAVLPRRTKESQTVPRTMTLLLSLVSFLFLTISFGIGLNPGAKWYVPLAQWISLALLLSLPATYLWRRCPAKIRTAVFLCAIAGALTIRALLPTIAPSPFIDVFSIPTHSAQALLDGKNPYQETFPDIYGGRGFGGRGFAVVHYQYPPASLYLHTISFLFSGDVRMILILCDALFALLLWMTLRGRWPSDSAQLMVLLFLFHPRSLFILEAGWNEPMLLAGFALSAWLLLKKRTSAAMIAYGYFLGLKQYLLFFSIPLLLAERRWSRLALAVGVTVLTIAPFLLWNSRAVIDHGILGQIQDPARLDSLSLSSFLAPYVGLIGKPLSLGVGILGSALIFFRFRKDELGFLLAAPLLAAILFTLGGQAFANYYYFESGLILFALAASTGTAWQEHEPKQRATR